MRAGRVSWIAVRAYWQGHEAAREDPPQQHGCTIESKDLRVAAVQQVMGRQQTATTINGVTVESLNDHYRAISTDHGTNRPTFHLSTITTLTILPSQITSQHGKYS